ncbi:Rieske 2Fe-2S domain-containing protein [Janibacter sp. GXQ6167]|uniref:cytochrome bc1 complex Rieske iron-sulfur subunit n=1 Tax=Janibacter sp. GXQ6167 TaxID=3240791 RepID=UPI003524D9E1
MSEHSPHETGTPVPLDQGHVEGTGGIPERFANPGLPPHVPRASDLSEAAADRAEKQVAGLFTLSILGTLLFLVAYFMVDVQTLTFVPGLGDVSLSNILLGLGLSLGLLGIGLGAVHWAKTLMPDEESVEMRHPMRSSDEAREEFVATMAGGAESSQITRRPLMKATLGGALGLFSLPLLLQLVGSLGPLPKNDLSVTYWNGKKGEDGHWTAHKWRLVRDPENTPVKAEDVTIGSVFHILPEGLLDMEHHRLEEKGKAAVLLMRLNPDDFQDTPGGRKARDWGYQGIVAYSKICTHVGCPVGLYEQTTHHLLCPCHQSTFDVTDDCKVIFGPAKRPLPQLKITVDDEGYLIADQPFQEPVGPSFWERES